MGNTFNTLPLIPSPQGRGYIFNFDPAVSAAGFFILSDIFEVYIIGIYVLVSKLLHESHNFAP